MSHIASRKQFSRNLASGWVLLAAEILVAFSLTPFIILKLGAAAYGVWSLMIGVIGYMGLVDVGLRGSVGRYINHYLARAESRALNEVVSTSFAVLTGLALIAGLLAIGLAENFQTVFPKTPPELLDDIRVSLPLLALGLWLSFVSAILGNLLSAKEAMYLANGFGLLTLAARTGGVVWVLLNGHGIVGLVLVNLAASLLSNALMIWTVRRVFGHQTPRVFGFSRERLFEMWRFGIASFISRTASTMANDSAPIIGMWILGPEAVAIYSVALTLTQNARRLQDLANAAIFPSVMRAGALRDMAGLRALYLRFMDISFAIGSLVFIALIVFSGDFLNLWVGHQYASGAAVISILSIGYLLQGIASTGPLALQSLDRIGVTVKIGIAESVACVALTALLPGMFGLGLLGMALGSTIPRLVSNLALYPPLSIDAMGDELKRLLPRAIGRNLLICVGVGAAFSGLHFLLPGHSWPTMIASISIACTMHLLLMAMCYEGLPVIGVITDRLRRRLLGQVQI
ncbi:MAG: oligosaccharide flippase family protein [Rhizobacter sp.]|nr:oligosaccharide flippase family protein [Rhizobacter sp.]